MQPLIFLPGIGGSDEKHWQTIWERSDKESRRLRPGSWDNPDLPDWMAALEREVRLCTSPPLLVAHSLACLLVAHWAPRSDQPIAGAFLVAVPDPDGDQFPLAAHTFLSVPKTSLRFPSLMVASTNDPYASIEYTTRCCKECDSPLVIAGSLGHINAASGVNAWPQGHALLTAFRAGISKRDTHFGAT